MIKIRKATEKDSRILALLGRITFSESHGDYINNETDLLNYINESFSVSKIEKELSDSNIKYFIVLVNNLPVGYAKLVLNAIIRKGLALGKSCKLQRIYILNDFIRMKIGQQLLNLVIKKAQELKYKSIWLTVYIKNYRAINFYHKNNFKDVGKVNFLVNEKEYENLVFSKQL